MKFSVQARDGAARRGRLAFARGVVETPAFMPVGTYGTVKGVTPEELIECGAEIVLANTFHLMLRPGTDVVRAHGGLHGMMHWQRPILTDSGGYQVFSLSAMRKLTEEGVRFRSPVDGAEVFLGPERSMEVQRALDSDVAMVFDECTPYPASERQARDSMELSLRWSERSRRAWDAGQGAGVLFGIVQGGMHESLRAASLEGLERIAFEGLAIGGLSVGEPPDERQRVLAGLLPLMPEQKPRYLMGVGRPEDLVESVAAGIDLFDCVMPTRHARNGHLFVPWGVMNIRNARFAGRHRAGRSGLRLLHLPELQPRVPAAPGPLRRDAGSAARNAAQPALLPRSHGADARRRSRRGDSKRSAPVSTPRSGRPPALWHNHAPKTGPARPAPEEEGNGLFHHARVGTGRRRRHGQYAHDHPAAGADLRGFLFPADPAADQACQGTPGDGRQAGRRR